MSAAAPALIVTDAGGGLACGCDPRINHMCERHEVEAEFDSVLLSVECAACSLDFDVQTTRAIVDANDCKATCPHCSVEVRVERVEYGTSHID